MSIVKEGRAHVLRCDICGDKALQDFDDFWDAVQYKKDNGWKVKKWDGEWTDICTECQEGMK